MDTVSIDTLVAQGLLTEEQAQALRRQQAGQPQAAPARRYRVLPLVAEALGYVGAIVAFSGAAAATSTFWADLLPEAQVALLGLVTVLLLVAGAAVPGGAGVHPALRRLGSVLWLGSTAAFAGAVGLCLVEVLADVLFGTDLTNFLATSAATAVYAGTLWWFRRRCLQQIATFGAVLATVLAVLATPDHPPAVAWFGLVIAGLGAVWGVLGWGGVLEPERTALSLGSLGVLTGAQVIAFQSGWGLGLGLSAVAGLVAGGVAVRRPLLVGTGAAGLLVFLPQAIGHWLGDSVGAALVLIVSGLAVVAVGVVIARLRPAEEGA